MSHGEVGQVILDEAVADARLAAWEFDGARAWLEEARRHPMEPLAAEVWVTDPAFEHVLLVKHRVRGWVPPGGKVEPGEAPRAAAARELLEETGLRTELLPEPAAVAVRSYRADWSPTLGLSYAAIVGRDVPLAGEQNQPAAWFRLDTGWDSVFPEDRERIRAHARCLAAGRAVGSR
ncbi:MULTISPECIES: NUDIX domain-containing protein [unclassified Streptomyces]|uniref:NUDIX domain-containing protein n=1 Tax=unclassified Streptomyces TaxID=2593676 RepID=UPI000A8A6208|nr:NUDIX domain-containing protein [Streptomyces sp. HM190]